MVVTDVVLRRTTQEVRRLIVEAAVEVFAENGLDKPLMTVIAERAGVHRSVVYRHFDNQDELFRVALAQPFVEFIEGFSTTWQNQLSSPLSDELLLREFLSDLYSNFAGHRSALRILLANDPQSNTGSANHTRIIRQVMSRLTQILTDGMIQRGYPPVRVDLTERFIFYIVMGIMLFDEQFSPEPGGTSGDVLITHLTSFILYGVRLGPEPIKVAARGFRR